MKERMRLLTEKVSLETNSSCTVTRPFLKMSGIPSGGDERPRLDAASLPDELQRLWDTMLRLDPDWDMFEWLTERAKEELKIIDANLSGKNEVGTTNCAFGSLGQSNWSRC